MYSIHCVFDLREIRSNQKQRLDCQDNVSHNPHYALNIRQKTASFDMTGAFKPPEEHSVLSTLEENAAYCSSHLHTLATTRSSERLKLAL